MSIDNSPKIRQQAKLARKAARRASYKRILIVAEGGKTEPNYFKEIRKKYHLQSANVEVQPTHLGTLPIQVVQSALDIFQQGCSVRNIQALAFEEVYAVFDRDDHDKYLEALDFADRLNNNIVNDLDEPVIFKAIASIPCFELWLLLHFENIQAPMHRKDVYRALKQYIAGYSKGRSNTFALTEASLSTATLRAESLARRFSARTAPEPFTGIHEVTALLLSLKTP